MVVLTLESKVEMTQIRGNMTTTTVTCSTNGLKLKWQTNGNAITVDGQKPMLDNSIEKDRIAYCTRC